MTDRRERILRMRRAARTAPQVQEALNLYRPALLGAMDGLVTSFVIVLSGIVASVTSAHVLVIGGASLVADGISMAVSEFISTRGELSRVDASKTAVTCGVCFVMGGATPLVVFGVFANMEVIRVVGVVISYFVGILVVGLLRARVFDNLTVCQSVLEIGALGTIVGGVAASIAYLGAHVSGQA